MKLSLKKILIISIFILILLTTLTGCSTTTNNNNNNVTNTTNNEIQEELSFLDTFISNYNTNNTTPISNCINFIANDKSSPYYRTEFRLLAFQNAKCIHGNIGNCVLDIIDYSSQLTNTKHTQFRIYINSNNINETKEISSKIIKMLDTTISDKEIHEAYNSLSGSFYLGDNIKGTIIKNEIMIDYSITEFKDK